MESTVAPLAARSPAPARHRVAYLVNCYPRNSHSFIRREIRALEELGLEILRVSHQPLDEELASPEDQEELRRTRILLGAGAPALAAALAREGLRAPTRFARALRLAVRMGRRGNGVVRHLAYLAEACVLAGWLREAGTEHVHAHFGTNSATVALLCRTLGGPPFSFTVHGPEEFDRPEALSLGEKVARAAFTVAISSFGRAQLCRWTRFSDWQRLQVVRCGVDDAVLAAPGAAVPPEPRLLCVARLGEQKGHMVLVEAAAALRDEGVPFELTLIGDGPLRAPLEARVRALRLDDRIHFAGWTSGEGVRRAIHGSRALVLPSFAEGLPVVLMEALALGRPVVTTAIAGIPELVEHGVSGWIVPAGSPEALARAMRAALEAPPARLEEMGRAGAARARERHDVRREARKLADLFAESWAPRAG
jgi:glycosyltransferase involved in cell wall biosynthesis